MNLNQRIQDLYQDWAYGQSGVFKRASAWEELRPQVRQLLVDIASRGRESDLDAVAYQAFVQADESLTHAGDKVIRRANEEGQLPLAADRLDALVALGDGDRVKFGDMGMEEYRRAEERKYENVRRVQDAYDEWRRAWAPYMPWLTKGLKVRDVEARGLLTSEPEDDA